MKKIIFILVSVAALFFVNSVNAGNMHCENNNCEYTGDYGNGWSYKCWNASCEARSGKLSLYWTAKEGGVYSEPMGGGTVTGVDGLPIRLEMFKDSESRISEMFGEEDLATQMGRGKKISIDHSLNFLFWITEFDVKNGKFSKKNKEGVQVVPQVSDINIFLYMYVIGSILENYKNNTITPSIETYFFAQHVSDMDTISILDDKVSPFIKMVKILVTTLCNKVNTNDPELSYVQQYYTLVMDADNKERAENLSKVITRTMGVLKRFKTLCHGDYQKCLEQTDEIDLYLSGDKEVASIISSMKDGFSLSNALLSLGTGWTSYDNVCRAGKFNTTAPDYSHMETKLKERLAAKAEAEAKAQAETKAKAEEEKAKVKSEIKAKTPAKKKVKPVSKKGDKK